MTTERVIGTQHVLEAFEIGAPDYELTEFQVDETLDELLDQAIGIGEKISQSNIARGQGAAPHAHRSCTAYHAIEIIAMYRQRCIAAQAEVEQLRHRLDEINSAEDRRFE